jgi:hypothetical protein
LLLWSGGSSVDRAAHKELNPKISGVIQTLLDKFA